MLLLRKNQCIPYVYCCNLFDKKRIYHACIKYYQHLDILFYVDFQCLLKNIEKKLPLQAIKNNIAAFLARITVKLPSGYSAVFATNKNFNLKPGIKSLF